MKRRYCPDVKKGTNLVNTKFAPFCGLDGTRTRDPMRDRHVF